MSEQLNELLVALVAELRHANNLRALALEYEFALGKMSASKRGSQLAADAEIALAEMHNDAYLYREDR